ncbi:MAG TPA: SOS response-associated peptidase [Candidatus Acidoferrum sp.]|jgi:putative SOS response-associated peptidase YedK|nr:SOS response-associated peptidase [Candidatus Acidoferrum sp.]
MCGRYVFVPGEGFVNMINEQKRSSFEPENLKPNYNLAPMQTMPIFTAEGVVMMQWGLVPSWSKEFKPSFSSINARAETASEKPLYRTPFKKRRCLVPASGFYEWQARAGFKQPYLFTLNGRETFNFAGLYDIWYDKVGHEHYSYTILTTTPNDTMAGVHDRMPVILDADEEEDWLNPIETPADLQLLLDPYDGKMTKFEVSREVGNVKNNSEALLLPLNSK